MISTLDSRQLLLECVRSLLAHITRYLALHDERVKGKEMQNNNSFYSFEMIMILLIKFNY